MPRQPKKLTPQSHRKLPEGTTEKKRGALSTKEKEYIDEFVGKKSVAEIAEHLNRHSHPVKRYMDQKYMTHQGMTEEEETFTHLREKLSTRPYFTEICLQLTNIELEYFTKLWIEIIHQFREDVLPTEEMQIKQYIIIEVLMNRSMKERKRHIEDLERADKELAQLYRVPLATRDHARIDNLSTRISFLRNAIGSYTNEHTKLSADAQRIGKDLKATREQRIKHIESSKDTWAKYLRALEDEEVREREGQEMELMRLAKEKEAEKLSEWYEYADGEVGLPIMSAETILARDEKDKKIKEKEEVPHEK